MQFAGAIRDWGSRVKDLSPDQRYAIESLLGRSVTDDEGLDIQPARILKDARTGEERKRSYDNFLGHSDKLASRASGLPVDALDAAIDEGCDQARRRTP